MLIKTSLCWRNFWSSAGWRDQQRLNAVPEACRNNSRFGQKGIDNRYGETAGNTPIRLVLIDRSRVQLFAGSGDQRRKFIEMPRLNWNLFG